MELSGAEILIQSLIEHNIDTIFGYPGSCVMPILDKLFDNKDIKHILVRHEQGAVHAACGYAQLSNKPGVVLVTSGPGATNTITGIADAFHSKIPLLVITGQVSSGLLGTNAFQEADMITLTASITKWNCQICKANQISGSVAKAFKIANSESPGPVLLDITKDAQTGKTQYDRNNIDGFPTNDSTTPRRSPKNTLYAKVIKMLEDTGKDVVLVVDKVPNDFYVDKFFCSNKVISSRVFNVPGFGLPAAIGAKYAAPDKTICLVAGSSEFQSTMKELGVIKQQGIDIKIILFNDFQGVRSEIKNPDFIQLLNAYDIQGNKMNKNSDLSGCIQEMLNSTKSYLLEISI